MNAVTPHHPPASSAVSGVRKGEEASNGSLCPLSPGPAAQKSPTPPPALTGMFPSFAESAGPPSRSIPGDAGMEGGHLAESPSLRSGHSEEAHLGEGMKEGREEYRDGCLGDDQRQDVQQQRQSLHHHHHHHQQQAERWARTSWGQNTKARGPAQPRMPIAIQDARWGPDPKARGHDPKARPWMMPTGMKDDARGPDPKAQGQQNTKACPRMRPAATRDGVRAQESMNPLETQSKGLGKSRLTLPERVPEMPQRSSLSNSGENTPGQSPSRAPIERETAQINVIGRMAEPLLVEPLKASREKKFSGIHQPVKTQQAEGNQILTFVRRMEEELRLLRTSYTGKGYAPQDNRYWGQNKQWENHGDKGYHRDNQAAKWNYWDNRVGKGGHREAPARKGSHWKAQSAQGKCKASPLSAPNSKPRQWEAQRDQGKGKCQGPRPPSNAPAWNNRSWQAQSGYQWVSPKGPFCHVCAVDRKPAIHEQSTCPEYLIYLAFIQGEYAEPAQGKRKAPEASPQK